LAQRCAFILKLHEGKEEEYIRRHRDIWPEMLNMLREAGIRNYSIWLYGDRVFGYYESDDLAATEAFKASSPVQARWIEYMKDIVSPIDSDGSGKIPKCVFYME
jgi:L-rhamnose mutarotase